MFKMIFGKIQKEKRKKKVLRAKENHESVKPIFKPIQMITTFCRNSKFQSLDQVVKNRN